MDNHAAHYHAYLAWKRKALWITLLVIASCMAIYAAAYLKVYYLQKSLVQQHNQEAASTSKPACTEIENAIKISQENILFTWLTTLMQALPGCVKIEDFALNGRECQLTLVAQSHTAYMACIEAFANQYLLQHMHLEKHYVKDKKHYFNVRTYVY